MAYSRQFRRVLAALLAVRASAVVVPWVEDYLRKRQSLGPTSSAVDLFDFHLQGI